MPSSAALAPPDDGGDSGGDDDQGIGFTWSYFFEAGTDFSRIGPAVSDWAVSAWEVSAWAVSTWGFIDSADASFVLGRYGEI